MSEFNYTKWMQQNKVGPYGKMLNESGTGDAPFDFNKSAIESATGDKISHTEEDDYGRPIYWSTKNPNVTYYINDDDQIIKYDGETGERYPIGDLKSYDDPDFDIEPDTDADYEEPRDDFDMAGDYNDGEFWEGELKEWDPDKEWDEEEDEEEPYENDMDNLDTTLPKEGSVNEWGAMDPEDYHAMELVSRLEDLKKQGKINGANFEKAQDFVYKNAYDLYYDFRGEEDALKHVLKTIKLK